MQLKLQLPDCSPGAEKEVYPLPLLPFPAPCRLSETSTRPWWNTLPIPCHRDEAQLLGRRKDQAKRINKPCGMTHVSVYSYLNRLLVAAIITLSSYVCMSRTPANLRPRLYGVSQKKSPLRLSDFFHFFHKRLRIFNWFFTDLLHAPMYTRWHIFYSIISNFDEVMPY